MEKLALKKALFEELKKTNENIKKLEDYKNDKHAHIPSVDAKLTCLSEHKDFIQHLIDICVVRNKF